MTTQCQCVAKLADSCHHWLFSPSGDLGNTMVWDNPPHIFIWLWRPPTLPWSPSLPWSGLIYRKLSLLRTEIVTRVDNDRICVRYWIASTFSSDFLFHCCNTVWWCIYLTWNRQHCLNSWIDGFCQILFSFPSVGGPVQFVIFGLILSRPTIRIWRKKRHLRLSIAAL